MEFRIQKKDNENLYKYPTEDLAIAKKFADHLYKELQDFLMGVIVFGSAVRRQTTDKSDIDILVVTDDTKYVITESLVEAYRIIVEKIMVQTSDKLHINSMTFTAFWGYANAADPVVINILRDGVAIIDTGFFDPLQTLLDEGRIRPSEEAIWTYFVLAPSSLSRSKQHLFAATMDCYWAAIDSAHAALMSLGHIPPSPDHVAEMLESVLVGNGHIKHKYAINPTFRMIKR